MILRFHPLRFTFVAKEEICFPRGQAANILRGALGTMLRDIACVSDYTKIFAPRTIEGGPSGLADLPRPFVFRAWHLDGRTIAPDSSFYFDLHLFALEKPARDYFIQAFGRLASAGLGPRRSRVELQEVRRLDAQAELNFDEGERAVHSVSLQFVTPTELKAGSELAARPDFGVLAARLRDRISALSQIYGDGPLPIDFSAFGERARFIKMTRCQVEPVKVERRSTRTGQTHSIGGFIGEADYEGELTEFVPYLLAARWTGVGRQTVWGKGEVAVQRIGYLEKHSSHEETFARLSH